jgi:hypothetical protein
MNHSFAKLVHSFKVCENLYAHVLINSITNNFLFNHPYIINAFLITRKVKLTNDIYVHLEAIIMIPYSRQNTHEHMH